ncbi:MAG: hypothetical protein BRC25_03235, partial [Parcubacteria group bacterium SW_6_46_9]
MQINHNHQSAQANLSLADRSRDELSTILKLLTNIANQLQVVTTLKQTPNTSPPENTLSNIANATARLGQTFGLPVGPQGQQNSNQPNIVSPPADTDSSVSANMPTENADGVITRDSSSGGGSGGASDDDSENGSDNGGGSGSSGNSGGGGSGGGSGSAGDGGGNNDSSNQSPTASFSHTTTGRQANFTENSTDPDGDITSYQWSFGDGQSNTTANPTHTYNTSETFTVTLTVTDQAGSTDSISRDVSVDGDSTNDYP